VTEVRERRTRNERRRDFIESIIFSVILVVIGFALTATMCLMMCKAWATHPAEQPITYAQHMEAIGGEVG
jgi:hypothetical protein